MANYVQYRTTRFDLRGGMTPEFREAVNNNLHDLINPIYVLSVKENGHPMKCSAGLRRLIGKLSTGTALR